MESSRNAPTLALLVLECNDIDTAKSFYELLGLTFVSERHGSGPLHYAATLGSMVLEIYPRKKAPRPRLCGLAFTSRRWMPRLNDFALQVPESCASHMTRLGDGVPSRKILIAIESN